MSLNIRKVNGLGYLAVSVVAGITIIFLCDNSILQKKIYLKNFVKFAESTCVRVFLLTGTRVSL